MYFFSLLPVDRLDPPLAAAVGEAFLWMGEGEGETDPSWELAVSSPEVHGEPGACMWCACEAAMLSWSFLTRSWRLIVVVADNWAPLPKSSLRKSAKGR